VGWIQTIYPCKQSVTYAAPAGDQRGQMVSDVTKEIRDGDRADEDGKPGIWYETAQTFAITSAQDETVPLSDEPNVPFHPVYAGKAAPQFTGWKAVEISGEKIFRSWLVAYDKRPKAQEIVFLYNVHWSVTYDGRTDANGDLKPAGGGTKLLAHGPGQGSETPCLDEIPIDENTFPFKPI
jgi:hypothetical protein